MRGINFLAGPGTIAVFIGVFCFKAAFSHHPVKDKENREQLHAKSSKRYGKFFLLLTGILCFVIGILMIFKSFSFN